MNRAPLESLEHLARSLGDRLDTTSALELIHVGEAFVALEILASNVYELHVQVTELERKNATHAVSLWADVGCADEELELLLAAGRRDESGRWMRRCLTLEYASKQRSTVIPALLRALDLPEDRDTTWPEFAAVAEAHPLPLELVVYGWNTFQAAWPDDASALRGILDALGRQNTNRMRTTIRDS